MSKTFSVSIPDQDAPLLEAEAEEKGVSAAQVIRDRALSTFRERSSPTSHSSTPKPIRRAENIQSEEISQLWQELATLKEQIQSLLNIKAQIEAAASQPNSTTQCSFDQSKISAEFRKQLIYLEAIYLLCQLAADAPSTAEQHKEARMEIMQELRQSVESLTQA